MQRFLMVVAIVFGVTGSVRADDAADAQAMFMAGVAALEQSDEDAARVAFERSLELHPTSAAAFNLAGVLTDLGQPSAASTLYEELGRGVYGTLTPGQAGEVERLAGVAEAASAHIEVRVVASAPVQITVGQHQGTATEAEPFVLRVDPGEHTIRGELEGAPAVENQVEVRAGGQGRTLLRFQVRSVGPVLVEPILDPAVTIGDEPVDGVAPEERSGRAWLWVVLGLVAAGGVATAVVLATRDSDDERGTVLPATGTLLSF